MRYKFSLERTRKVIIFILDIIIYLISFVLSFLLRYQFSIPVVNFADFLNAIPYILLIFGVLYVLTGMYSLYNKRINELIGSIIVNQFIMTIIVSFIIYFGGWLAFPRTVIFIHLFVSIISLIIWRYFVYELYKKVVGKETVIVVGRVNACKRAIRNFESLHNDMYEITGIICNNFYTNLKNVIDDADIIYLTNPVSTEEYNKVLKYLTKKNKKTFLSTNFENLLLLNPTIKNIEDETFLKTSGFSITSEGAILKRIVDVIISFVVMVFLLPIFIIVSVLIKLTSKGPVFYKQTRITMANKEFEILKFRTMIVDAEKQIGPVLAQTNDTRITPLGKYLRTLRIDELPQLINVLKGDMSLVGPRPERPYFVRKFNEKNDYYYLRHNVRAGITGYAQVYGKYITDFESKLNFDLIYIKKQNFFLDLQILIQTIRILFDKVSSQGQTEEDKNYDMFKGIEVYR